MTSHSLPRSRPLAACLALASALLFTPATADATPETLKRSVSNLIFAPVDLVLSPIVAIKIVNQNIRDIEDTTAVRIAYYLPGIVFLTGVQFGAAVLRGVTGALEFLPGLGLFFLEADLDPLFDPVDRGAALVELDNEIFPIKFGISYTTAGY